MFGLVAGSGCPPSVIDPVMAVIGMLIAEGRAEVPPHDAWGSQPIVGTPAQAPFALQTSPWVQGMPSSQADPAGFVTSGKLFVASSQAPYATHGPDAGGGAGTLVVTHPAALAPGLPGEQISTPSQ